MIRLFPECLRDEQVDLLVAPLGRRQALQEHEQRVEVRPLQQLALPLLKVKRVATSLKTRSRELRVSHFTFCMFNEQVLRTSHLAVGLLIWPEEISFEGGHLIWE